MWPFFGTTLLDASFSRPSLGAWKAGYQANNVALEWIDDPAEARDGSSFLRANMTGAGGSVFQDTPLEDVGGVSHNFGLWLRAAPGSPTLSEVNVSLWALGGAQDERANTLVFLGYDWTFVTVGFDPLYDHDVLRTEVYSATSIDMDGAQLYYSSLLDASFSQPSLGAWKAGYQANNVALGWFDDPLQAKDGSSFLHANMTGAGGSVFQDTNIFGPFNAGESYSFGLWLRAAPGSPLPAEVNVSLWALGGAQDERANTLVFLGYYDWTFVTVGLDLLYDHDVLRTEVYSATSIDMDGARLWPAQLKNASFSRPSLGAWGPVYQANNVALEWIDDPLQAKDGSGFLRVNMSGAGGSVAQDLEIVSPDVIAEDSYSLRLWLRVAPGSPTLSEVNVSLWALGGAHDEHANTLVILGYEWTLVTVGLDVVNNGHGVLRAEVYSATSIDMDGGVFVGFLGPIVFR